MSRKKEKGSLEMLVQLLDHRQKIMTNLERLNSMRGKDKDGDPLCIGIEFSPKSGAHVNSYAWDPDFNVHIVEEAIAYYTKRLENVTLLLGLAERAVNKEIGAQLVEALQRLNAQQQQ